MQGFMAVGFGSGIGAKLGQRRPDDDAAQGVEKFSPAAPLDLAYLRLSEVVQGTNFGGCWALDPGSEAPQRLQGLNSPGI
jgi:hypothetical protein